MADRPQQQFQQACAAIDRALRGGETARAEDWLSACPALAADEDLAVELVFSEYVAREELGPPPTPGEFLARFPQYAERLRRLFELDGLLAAPLRETGATQQGESTAADTNPIAPAADSTPRRLPGFDLIRCLGAGGMGVVWLAEQQRPRRRVAVKLMRTGLMAGAVELARFRREADVVARLRHPQIVSLHEVGEHGGEPFLVFEYIAGGNLKQRLAGQPLPARTAARLVAVLARAVQHAHEQGVVHRDLKPANILLDGEPQADLSACQPKITDFGLATVAGGMAGLTRSGQAVGTLAYMAPEQAAGAPGGAEPAVDIYALGAILYECLTGRPPLVADAEPAQLKLLLDAEPVAPTRLRPGLPRDLETIALCCLAKSPRRRYATAAALADDLERFLGDQPIAARPVRWPERAARWLRRRPAVAAALLVAMVAVVTVSVVVAIYTRQQEQALIDVRDQRDRADAAAEQARVSLANEQRRRDQARAALDALTARLIADGTSTPRRPADQLAALNDALKAYEEFATETAHDPVGRYGAAEARAQAGRLLLALGRYDEAEQSMSAAVAMLQQLRAEWPAELKYARRWAGALLDRGNVRWTLKRYDDALADLEAALVVQRQLDAKGGDVADRANLARMLVAHATMLRFKRPDQAEPVAADGIRTWEELVRLHPHHLPYRHGLASALHNQAMFLGGQGQLAQAETLLRRVLAMRQPGEGETLTPLMRLDLALSHELLGGMLASQKRLDEAATEWRAAVAVLDALYADQPNAVTSLIKATEILSRASRQVPTQDWEVEMMRWEDRLARWLTVNDAADTAVQLGGFQCNHGGYLAQRKKLDAALAAFDRAVRTLAPLTESEPPAPQARQFLANSHVGRAMTLMRLNNPQEAVLAWDAAIRWDGTPQRPIYQLERARTLVQAGDLAGAIAAAGAADRADDPDLFLRRALVHVLAGQHATDARLQEQCEAGAMLWLRRLRQAGRCGESTLRLLRGGGDWAWLRSRPAFQAWLAEP